MASAAAVRRLAVLAGGMRLSWPSFLTQRQSSSAASPVRRFTMQPRFEWHVAVCASGKKRRLKQRVLSDIDGGEDAFLEAHSGGLRRVSNGENSQNLVSGDVGRNAGAAVPADIADSDESSGPLSALFQAVGVFDGVGGWAEAGVDPAEFSHALARHCAQQMAVLDPPLPKPVLTAGYKALKTEGRVKLGSTTACLAVLHTESGVVYTANLGDSGFLLVRNGQQELASEPQQYSFNFPYQLGLTGNGNEATSPAKADATQWQAQDGDVLILATDGLYDNVHHDKIVEIVNASKDEREAARALLVEALDVSYNFPRKGVDTRRPPFGEPKIDDVSVVVAIIRALPSADAPSPQPNS